MSAKDIILKPITAAEGNAVIRRTHYSGKVVNNSQIHIGVYYRGKLEGAMQFGPSLDKRKVQGLVSGTGWNEFIELNRMAFSDALPRNSESRALGVAFRMLKKHAPHLKWIISFSDATQSGDGTIYRASGFLLTSIKQNDQIWQDPEGNRISRVTVTKGSHALKGSGAASMSGYSAKGYQPLPGFQLRYIYFLDSAWRERLTVPELPFSRIQEMGAGMYKGERRTLPASVGSINNDAAAFQAAERSVILTSTLQTQER